MDEIKMKILIVFVGLLIFGICKYVLHLRDDNAVEEQVEEVIKNQTGMDIDLTPSSLEK